MLTKTALCFILGTYLQLSAVPTDDIDAFESGSLSVRAEIPTGINPIDYLPDRPRLTVLEMNSFKDAIAAANASRDLRFHDFPAWDDIRGLYCPRLNKDNIKGYADKNPETLRMAVVLFCHVQGKFNDMFENREKLIKDVILMRHIQGSYSPELASALCGYLLMGSGRHVEALMAFEAAGSAVSIHAQEFLNNAARLGEHGFKAISGAAYLRTRASLGDEHAQQMINMTALNGRLGFDEISGAVYLQERVDRGDEHAQQMINQAALFCRLGFTCESRLPHLQNRARLGDQHAQQILNQAALNGWFIINDAVSGFDYLEERAGRGDKHAQQMINQAALNGWFRFNVPSSGRIYLEERIRIYDDEHAQQIVNQAALNGRLGFSCEEGLAYLQVRESLGDEHAKQMLNRVAWHESDGLRPVSGRAYLGPRARDGDKDAQNWLSESARTGKLGFIGGDASSPWFFHFYNMAMGG